jgi:predicted O-methyltransferase YrrM
LRRGKVIDEKNKENDVIVLKKLNEKIYNDNRVDISLLSIGDGLLLCIKK